METYIFDFLTEDNCHIETETEDFGCLALATDYARMKIGETDANGSVVGKVKIHQHGDESDDDCITITER